VGSQYPALEWLSLRRDGESPALIAHRAGVPVSAVTRATDPYGPFPRPVRQLGRVVAPEDVVDRRVARWVQLRRDGMRVTAIAAQEGVFHQIVSKATLPFGPYPEPHPPEEVIQRWVTERKTGIPATVIAAVAGVSVDLVRRSTQPYGPFPAGGSRIPSGWVGASGAATLAGVSHPTILRWIDIGFMPPADVVTGTGRLLWCEATITTWLNIAPLRTCPTCGAKLKRPTAHSSQSRCASLGPAPKGT
jgi:predicted DNA-binding transcriptional regulator AlpA